MTDDELLALRFGARVWVTSTNDPSSKRIPAVVDSVDYNYGLPLANVRRIPKNGMPRMPRFPRFSSCVELMHDPTTANVFADFLEEHGYAEAADLLRKNFPIYTGEPAQVT